MPDASSGAPMEITFYGVRGSIPAAPTAPEIQGQIAAALHRASCSGSRFASPEEAENWLVENLPFHERASYGGDSTCVFVRCGATQIVIDAGSGIRRLGLDLMPDLKRTGQLELHMLFTHMHMDHIVGFPFFAPLFAKKRLYSVRLIMHGGAGWRTDLQSVLESTVTAPLFPLELDKLEREAAAIEFNPVYDGLSIPLGATGDVVAHCRRLHHPNETYGWRLEYGGKVLVFATDTEPYAGPDRVLAELSEGADLLYIDGQYDREQYVGDYDGQSRVGWGHGYAEWCAEVAREAGARVALMGHHDPAASNERIFLLGEKMRAGFENSVVAFDGLRARIEDGCVIVNAGGDRAPPLRVARK